LRLTEVIDDSTDFQFEGSELYLRDIPLRGETPRSNIFSKTDLREFKRKANELNRIGDGDSAAFYFQPQV